MEHEKYKELVCHKQVQHPIGQAPNPSEQECEKKPCEPHTQQGRLFAHHISRSSTVRNSAVSACFQVTLGGEQDDDQIDEEIVCENDCQKEIEEEEPPGCKAIVDPTPSELMTGHLQCQHKNGKESGHSPAQDVIDNLQSHKLLLGSILDEILIESECNAKCPQTGAHWTPFRKCRLDVADRRIAWEEDDAKNRNIENEIGHTQKQNEAHVDSSSTFHFENPKNNIDHNDGKRANRTENSWNAHKPLNKNDLIRSEQTCIGTGCGGMIEEAKKDASDQPGHKEDHDSEKEIEPNRASKNGVPWIIWHPEIKQERSQDPSDCGFCWFVVVVVVLIVFFVFMIEFWVLFLFCGRRDFDFVIVVDVGAESCGAGVIVDGI